MAAWPRAQADRGMWSFRVAGPLTCGPGPFKYSNDFPKGFKCRIFENTKDYLPDLQKFPNIAWWYRNSNETSFLFGLTSKSSWILN
jgi:hypothetical protein